MAESLTDLESWEEAVSAGYVPCRTRRRPQEQIIDPVAKADSLLLRTEQSIGRREEEAAEIWKQARTGDPGSCGNA